MTAAAKLALIVTIPHGATAVLLAVKAGLSPWHGWEADSVACSDEGAEAYGVRARLITQCRERGLLTPENFLTEAGREALSAWEGRGG